MLIELTCWGLVEFVADYPEGALPAPKRGRVEAHLADCPDCPVYLEQMRLTIWVLGGLGTKTLFPRDKEPLVRLFRHRTRGDGRHWRHGTPKEGQMLVAHRPRGRTAMILAAALLCLFTAASTAAAGGASVPHRAVVDGRAYDAYVPAATKEGQWEHFTCEFDAAWAILKTFGVDAGLEEQLALVGHDRSVEPYYVETPDGIEIHGGDISTGFSGDYRTNFLARASGAAMRPMFERFGLPVEPVHDRAGVEGSLRRGQLVWMKATVDFLPWTAATWVTPTGERYPTVLGNDHAVVVMGYNQDGVLIRDVLGPTSSNWGRPYRYHVDWETFLDVWEAQGFDGLAVGPSQDGQ